MQGSRLMLLTINNKALEVIDYLFVFIKTNDI